MPCIKRRISIHEPDREEVLFALALEKPAEKRAAFLDAICEGDAALRYRGTEMLRPFAMLFAKAKAPWRQIRP